MWRCSSLLFPSYFLVFFFQAEDGIRDRTVTGVQTCALPISNGRTDLGSFLNQEHVGPAVSRVLRRGAPGRTRAHDEDVDLAVHLLESDSVGTHEALGGFDRNARTPTDSLAAVDCRHQPACHRG